MPPKADLNWSLSWNYQTTWPIPFPAWPETLERVKKSYEYEAYIKVFSDECEQVLYFREGHISKRNRLRIQALIAVLSRFMEKIDFSLLARRELLELGLAFEDLEKGIVRDCFRPSYNPKSPEHPSDKWASRALLAISVDVLNEAGFSQRAASKLIAKVAEVSKLILAPDSRNFAQTIANWHRQFRAGVKDPRAHSLFEKRSQLVMQTYAHLEKQGVAAPSVHDVAVNIAYVGTMDALWTATQDEHDAVYQKLKRRRPLK